MLKNIFPPAVVISVALLSGCASVPMASDEQDAALKTFPQPSANNAGLYIFRNTFGGQALKKTVSIDGSIIGETANKVYFYKEIPPGEHTLSTESEFSDNATTFQAASGKNYFAEQLIKMGAFVGGADIKMVSEEVGKREVLECKLAK
jgi:hypothetical protein